MKFGLKELFVCFDDVGMLFMMLFYYGMFDVELYWLCIEDW